MSAHFSKAMQDREQQKRSHFDAFWHVKRWGVFFAIAKAWSIVFRAHFAVIFVYFGVTLHDFAYPSGSLFKVYEWPMKQFRNCNFDHFLKRFWHGKNRGSGDVWWISWQLGVKLCRQKVRQIHVICAPGFDFLNNLRVTSKNDIPEAKGCWLQYNFRKKGHPKIQVKLALAGVQMDLKQGTKGTENGTVGTFYFSI